MHILLSQVYYVWQVVKTPTIILNNPVFHSLYFRCIGVYLWRLSIRLFVLLYPDFILRIGEQNSIEYESGELYKKINYPLQFAFRSDNCNNKLTLKCVWSRKRIFCSKYPQNKCFSFKFWACEQFYRLWTHRETIKIG